jgi:hypothetical protein
VHANSTNIEIIAVHDVDPLGQKPPGKNPDPGGVVVQLEDCLWPDKVRQLNDMKLQRLHGDGLEADAAEKGKKGGLHGKTMTVLGLWTIVFTNREVGSGGSDACAKPLLTVMVDDVHLRDVNVGVSTL